MYAELLFGWGGELKSLQFSAFLRVGQRQIHARAEIEHPASNNEHPTSIGCDSNASYAADAAARLAASQPRIIFFRSAPPP